MYWNQCHRGTARCCRIQTRRTAFARGRSTCRHRAHVSLHGTRSFLGFYGAGNRPGGTTADGTAVERMVDYFFVSSTSRMVKTRSATKSTVSVKQETHLAKMREAAVVSRRRQELERLLKRVEELKAYLSVHEPANASYRGVTPVDCSSAGHNLQLCVGNVVRDGCSEAGKELRSCARAEDTGATESNEMAERAAEAAEAAKAAAERAAEAEREKAVAERAAEAERAKAVAERAAEAEREKAVAENGAEVERAKAVAERAAEVERAKVVAERAAEVERAKAVAERAAEVERAKAVAERAAEVERAKAVAERAAEAERAKAVAERAAEAERAKAVAERAREVERAKAVAEKAGEVERAKVVAERAAEAERVKKRAAERAAEAESTAVVERRPPCAEHYLRSCDETPLFRSSMEWQEVIIANLLKQIHP